MILAGAGAELHIDIARPRNARQAIKISYVFTNAIHIDLCKASNGIDWGLVDSLREVPSRRTNVRAARIAGDNRVHSRSQRARHAACRTGGHGDGTASGDRIAVRTKTHGTVNG